MRYVTYTAVVGTVFANTVLSTGPLVLFARSLHAGDALSRVPLAPGCRPMAVIFQVLLVREVEERSARSGSSCPAYFFAGLFALRLVIIPWLPDIAWLRQGVLIASIALPRCLRQPGLVAWMPLIGDVTPDDVRGRFSGTMRTAWQSLALGLALLIALLFGKSAQAWQFQVRLWRWSARLVGATRSSAGFRNWRRIHGPRARPIRFHPGRPARPDVHALRLPDGARRFLLAPIGLFSVGLHGRRRARLLATISLWP